MIVRDVDFDKWCDDLAANEAQIVNTPMYWADKLKARINKGDQVYGDTTPWSKLNDKFRFRPGEISLVAGYSGHMKSFITTYYASHLVLNLGKRVAMASLELHPEETLYRMACHVAACAPSPEFGDKFLQATDELMAIYDQVDSVEASRIYGFVRFVSHYLKCDHIIIDSLTKLGIKKSDTDMEKQVVDRLQKLAKASGKHIHLVCHCRKPDGPQGEMKMPTKQDIGGASEIVSLADNVIMVWTDPKKKQLKDKMDRGDILTEAQNEHMERPDTILGFEKQRHGKWEGKCGLWFKRNQFISAPNLPPTRFGDL